jgi:hypothetical protein
MWNTRESSTGRHGYLVEEVLDQLDVHFRLTADYDYLGLCW